MEEIQIQTVGFEALPMLKNINRALFAEERIINRFDRPDLVMMVAVSGETPVGFKVGYGLDGKVYYSAKGGVLEPFRRRGIAGALLSSLMDEAIRRGYRTYCFDTFPNRHPGMTVLALQRGFVVSEVRFSEVYKDLRVRFSTSLDDIPTDGKGS